MSTTNVTAIKAGPFTGTTPEFREILDRDGVPVVRHGQIARHWPVHARTLVVLDTFPTKEGWAIKVTAEPSDLRLPDPNTWVLDAANNPAMANQPCVVFQASLVSPKGDVVATGSVLAIINGPGAWESGETRARGRLYDAIGIRGSCDDESEGHLPTKTSSAETRNGTVASVTPIEPRPGRDREKLPEEAKAIIAEEVAKEAPPVKESIEAGDSAKAESNDQVEVETEAGTETEGSGISKNLLNQIIFRAKVKGVDVPEFASKEEAMDFYKGMLAAGKGV